MTNRKPCPHFKHLERHECDRCIRADALAAATQARKDRAAADREARAAQVRQHGSLEDWCA